MSTEPSIVTVVLAAARRMHHLHFASLGADVIVTPRKNCRCSNDNFRLCQGSTGNQLLPFSWPSHVSRFFPGRFHPPAEISASGMFVVCLRFSTDTSKSMSKDPHAEQASIPVCLLSIFLFIPKLSLPRILSLDSKIIFFCFPRGGLSGRGVFDSLEQQTYYRTKKASSSP